LFLIINIYFIFAKHFSIVDNPNERSSHDKPIIRGGGIIIPIGIMLWFFWSDFQYPWFFAGLVLISFISFMDDIFQITFWIRLLTHLLAIFLLILQVELTPIPWWAWILALFITVGIINAFNFMDGINGITSSYSLSVLIGLWIVNNFQTSFTNNELLYATCFAVIIFSFYNFRTQARCFAGDVGSISISFIIIFLISKLVLITDNPFYLLFLSIYGVDSFLTLVNRLFHNENIFKPHRQHLYQFLANDLGISHLLISTCYSLIQFFINIFVIILMNYLSYFYFTLFTIGIFLVLSLFYITIKSKFSTKQRSKNESYLY